MCDLATLDYVLDAEDSAEINRHHRDFAKISELAAEAEVLISKMPVPRSNTTCEQLHSTIRSIRNLVG